MPSVTSLNTSSRYAYTSHYNQHGLSRLDTVTLNFDGSLDLSKWQCQDTELHHLAIGENLYSQYIYILTCNQPPFIELFQQSC